MIYFYFGLRLIVLLILLGNHLHKRNRVYRLKKVHMKNEAWTTLLIRATAMKRVTAVAFWMGVVMEIISALPVLGIYKESLH